MSLYSDVFSICKSSTSRSKYENEKAPDRYIYSVTDFSNCLEKTTVRGITYGINQNEVKKIEDEGKIPVIEVNTVGAQQLVDKAFTANYVFVFPKQVQQLRERISHRINDTEEKFKERLKEGIRDIEFANSLGIFNNFLINDVLELAQEQLITMIDALYFQEIKEIRKGDPVKKTQT